MQALSQDPNFTAAAGDYVGGMKADLEEEIKALPTVVRLMDIRIRTEWLDPIAILMYLG